VPELAGDAVAVLDVLFSLAEVAAMTGRTTSSIKTPLWRACAAFARAYGAER